MKSRARRTITSPNAETELLLWEYIYRNVCRSNKFDEVDEELMNAFSSHCETPRSPSALLTHYKEIMAPALYKADLADKLKLELYKTLEIPIESHVEKILEKTLQIGIRLDEKKRLVDFKVLGKRDGRVRVKKEVRTPSPRSTPSPPPREPEEPDEPEEPEEDELEVVIWELIAKRFSKLTPLKIMSAKVWGELFDNHEMPTRSSFTAQRYFVTNMLDKMWRQPLEPTSRKLRIMRDLGIVVKEQQKAWLLEHEHVDVQIDDDGYLVTWKFENGNGEEPENEVPEMPRDQITPPPPKKNKIDTWEPLHSTPTTSRTVSLNRSPDERKPLANVVGSAKRVPFSQEDDLNAWKYIIKNVYDEDVNVWDFEKTELKGCVFWRKYVEKSKSTKTAANWSSHYRKVMCPNLYKMALSIEIKLNLYFFLRLPMSEEAQKSLEAEGRVKVTLDPNETIERWDWNDERD